MRLEEEARAAQAKLIQADKMASLGLLVSGIAHEINNPNNFIMFNSALLEQAWSSALPLLEEYYRENGDFTLGDFQFSETQEILPRLFSGLEEGSRRIRDIVDKLKTFARQDGGDPHGKIDLNKVILDAVAILNHEIRVRCDSFYFDAATGVPPALGNTQQIEQVMINLIINALHALPDRKRAVRIATSATEEKDVSSSPSPTRDAA